jgi:hypothetical protein
MLILHPWLADSFQRFSIAVAAYPSIVKSLITLFEILMLFLQWVMKG